MAISNNTNYPTCAHPGCQEPSMVCASNGLCFSHQPESDQFMPPWHGPVAQRLRQLYAHRLEHVERIPYLQENFPIIGIPWDQWAELSQERTHNLDPKHPHPWDGIGVESKGKSYDDAIAVFGRHWESGATGGNVYFWFYPVVRS